MIRQRVSQVGKGLGQQGKANFTAGNCYWVNFNWVILLAISLKALWISGPLVAK